MTAAPRPTVSVIVPVLDGLDDLQRCVSDLLAQDYPPELVQIIVADNGSAIPPAGQLPPDPRLQVVTASEPGSYAARNQGLAVATGDVIAFTDADCRPQRDWLRQSIAALDLEPPAELVGGAIDLSFRSGRPVTGAEWYEHLHGFPQKQYLERGFAVTANLTTRRSVIDRVGRFDASLASGGDAEWCRRVQASGGLLRWAPAAKVRHPARATRADLLRKSRRTTEGVAIKTRRQTGGRRRLLRMVLGTARDVVQLTVTVWLAPQPDSARAKAAYLGVQWANAGAVIAVLLRNLAR